VSGKCRIIALFAAALLGGCTSYFSGLPKAVEEAAVADQKKGYDGYMFKDFRVTCAEAEKLTAAETANGASEKWCVRLEYIFQRPGDARWQDADNTWNGLTYQDKGMGKILLNLNGVWQTKSEDRFCQCIKQ
jgi:hypothetical protein